MRDEIEELDGPPVPNEARQEPWEITDEGKAAWAVDKVLAARERLARIKAACQAMIAEAEREAEDTEALFKPQLEAWARANPPRKGKTIKLMTGALAFRIVPGGPRVTDADAVIAWARAEGVESALRVKEVVSVDAAGLRAYVEASGDLPPGVDLVEAREAFDVKGA